MIGEFGHVMDEWHQVREKERECPMDGSGHLTEGPSVKEDRPVCRGEWARIERPFRRGGAVRFTRPDLSQGSWID